MTRFWGWTQVFRQFDGLLFGILSYRAGGSLDFRWAAIKRRTFCSVDRRACARSSATFIKLLSTRCWREFPSQSPNCSLAPSDFKGFPLLSLTKRFKFILRYQLHCNFTTYHQIRGIFGWSIWTVWSLFRSCPNFIKALTDWLYAALNGADIGTRISSQFSYRTF